MSVIWWVSTWIVFSRHLPMGHTWPPTSTKIHRCMPIVSSNFHSQFCLFCRLLECFQFFRGSLECINTSRICKIMGVGSRILRFRWRWCLSDYMILSSQFSYKNHGILMTIWINECIAVIQFPCVYSLPRHKCTQISWGMLDKDYCLRIICSTSTQMCFFIFSMSHLWDWWCRYTSWGSDRQIIL